MILLIGIMLFNLPLYPDDGDFIYYGEVIFEWRGYGSFALVDDNVLFSSPEKIERGDVLNLNPGVYYWKVSGWGITNMFEVKSLLDVGVDGVDGVDGGEYLKNKGTENANVDVKDGGKITGSFMLGVGEDKNLGRVEEKEREVVVSAVEG